MTFKIIQGRWGSHSTSFDGKRPISALY